MTTKKNKRGPPPKGSRPTPQRTSPAFVTPMPAQVVKRLPEGGGWVYELKFDGYRALVIKDEPGRTRSIGFRSCLDPVRSSFFLDRISTCCQGLDYVA